MRNIDPFSARFSLVGRSAFAGSAAVLERASTFEGPWETVTESMQTVDGENRVTILTDLDNAYFRLREE